jgi:hypothetical protein
MIDNKTYTIVNRLIEDAHQKKWGQEKKFIDSPVFFPPFSRFTRLTFVKILPGT